MAWVLLAAVALVSTDLCCFNSPGGQLLLTQVWDSNPAVGKFSGPEKSWTIHGFWPNLCDGTFEESCDPSRKYTKISDILKTFGQTELLSDMHTLWPPGRKGDEEAFWEREWDKHGTCISSLAPSCYNDYTPQQEVVDYFQSAVNLYKKIDSYKFLAEAGIFPSATKTYTASEISEALKRGFGHDVAIRCSGYTLHEISYTFRVRGSVPTGTFEATTPVGVPVTCPAADIRYVPKTGEIALMLGPPPLPASVAPIPFYGKGILEVILDREQDKQRGCLIRSGSWYTRVNCATFTAIPITSGSGFTLRTVSGPCQIQEHKLVCDPKIYVPTIFTSRNGLLEYGESNLFFAAAIPAGSEKLGIYTALHKAGMAVKTETLKERVKKDGLVVLKLKWAIKQPQETSEENI
ncbi:ribonuclease T [Marssonina coronariae]|uniref:Ribonuclease T n=1 Tax=Diplocarpon coronariae TaxID=2795749 RepID=A0A218Z9T3_9HELO|nr:ribonuclease T [Marssonina coronariae]